MKVEIEFEPHIGARVTTTLDMYPPVEVFLMIGDPRLQQLTVLWNEIIEDADEGVH